MLNSQNWVFTEHEQLVSNAIRGGVKCVLPTPSAPSATSIIHGEVLAAMLMDPPNRADGGVPFLRLENARVEGKVELCRRRVEPSVQFKNCVFDDGIDLSGSTINRFETSESVVPKLVATNLECAQDFRLTDHCRIAEVQLDLAVIGGDLNIDELFGKSITVRGARIGGNLTFDGSMINNPKGVAIDANAASVVGYVFFRNGFSAVGEVKLIGAEVGRQIAFHGGSLQNEGPALSMDEAVVGGDVVFVPLDDKNPNSALTVSGSVLMRGMSIGGQLLILGCSVSWPDRDAFVADGTHVSGDVFVEPKEIEGDVMFSVRFDGFAVVKYPSQVGMLSFDGAFFNAGASIELMEPVRDGARGGFQRGMVTFRSVSFNSPVRIEDKDTSKSSPTEFNFENASGSRPLVLYSDYAEVHLDRSVLAEGTSFAKSRAGSTDNNGKKRKLTIKSVKHAQLAGLNFESVDLSRCELRDAIGIDRLRITGESIFCSPHRTKFLSPDRRVTYDELQLRLCRAECKKKDGWIFANLTEADREPSRPEFSPDSTDVESTYRSLRHSSETNGDVPGANDFYFGEMQMRELSTRSARGTKTLIKLYGITSGYATYAPRAAIGLMMTFGLTVACLYNLKSNNCPTKNGIRAAESTTQFVLDIANAVANFQSGWRTCNLYGLGASMFGLLSLVFLGLTILSIRSRVRR